VKDGARRRGYPLPVLTSAETVVKEKAVSGGQRGTGAGQRMRKLALDEFDQVFESGPRGHAYGDTGDAGGR
jgi:hypothetical protein